MNGEWHLKQLWEKIKKRFYNHEADLESRLGTMFISIGVIAALCGLFVCMGAQVSRGGIITVGAIFVLTPLIMTVAYKLGRQDIGRVIMIVGVAIGIPIVWLTSGGVNSGCNVWFVFEFFFIALALKGIPLIVALVCATGLDSLCYWLSAAHPEYVFIIQDPERVYVSTCGSVIIVSIALILTVQFQKHIYNNEREVLLKTQSNLEHANHYQKAFLSNMSHEIRTPLNAIMGMNEMILRENNIDEVKKYAREIREASQSLLAIVNDMLDFTRLESGNMEIHTEDYAPTDLLNTCYVAYKGRVKERNLDLFIKNNPKIPAKLHGDPSRIQQVISHLLGNSLQFTEKGYITLTFDMERQPQEEILLVIRVDDSGKGIPEAEKEEIYDIFRRETDAAGKAMQGTGLGIAITKNLVELMGGTLEFESKVGEGTTFIAKVPQRIVDATPMGLFHKEDPNASHVYEEGFHAPDARVLVVDDIDLNLKVIKGLLKKTQVQVDTALSGREAVDKCRVNHYQVIFMDHMMPEMDGIEAFHIIRNEIELNRDTPVVMLTANAIVGARNDYLAEGFSDYISKPVKADLLEKVLRKYI